jgi:hypothetical protein
MTELPAHPLEMPPRLGFGASGAREKLDSRLRGNDVVALAKLQGHQTDGPSQPQNVLRARCNLLEWPSIALILSLSKDEGEPASWFDKLTMRLRWGQANRETF